MSDATFFITFGQRHWREPHSFWTLTPDDWVEVTASDMEEARRAVFDLVGSEWSMIYTEDEWNDTAALYPGECVGKIVAATNRATS